MSICPCGNDETEMREHQVKFTDGTSWIGDAETCTACGNYLRPNSLEMELALKEEIQ